MIKARDGADRRALDHGIIPCRGDTPRNICGVESPTRHRFADLPGHNMIGTRCVAGDADRADLLLAAVVQGQTAAEHVDAADAILHEWIVGGAEPVCVALIRDGRIDRISECFPAVGRPSDPYIGEDAGGPRPVSGNVTRLNSM